MTEEMIKVKFLGYPGVNRTQTFSWNGKIFPQNVWIAISKKDARFLVEMDVQHVFTFDPPLRDTVEKPDKPEKPKGGKT